MIIKVGTNFQITSDDNNYTLDEKMKKPYKYMDKKTQTVKLVEWKHIGNWNKLSSVYKHLFELKVRRIDQVEIKAVIREMKEIRREIEKHFKGTEPGIN